MTNLRGSVVITENSILTGSKNYGLPILCKIQDINFGKDATMKIIETQLKELGKCSAAEKLKFMVIWLIKLETKSNSQLSKLFYASFVLCICYSPQHCLSKSRIIRRHHFELPKLRVSRQDDTCRVTKSSNKAGESLLHRLCGDPKKHERLDLTLSRALDEIEKSATGSVNVPDNGYNFPLRKSPKNSQSLDQSLNS